MFTLYSPSEASTSAGYRIMEVGLFFQDRKDISYVSSDRAAEIVAKMASKDRKALLRPIEMGLIDPQSVFYLIDHKSKGQVAICVEDFVRLASNCISDENNVELHSGNACSTAEDDTPIPQRLLDELRRILECENSPMFEYTSVDNESGHSSPSGQTRSRGESTASEGSMSSNVPILPKSRPPAPPSFPAGISCTTQKYSVSKDANVIGNCYLPADRSMSSAEENIEANKEEYGAKINSVPKRRFLFVFVIAAILAVATALAIGIYFLIKSLQPKESLTKTTVYSIPGKIKTFDCVNGSTHEISLDGTMQSLFELNLPEQSATLTEGSLEYLFVPNFTSWWDAQKYCTAWCGYLVSIKGPEENEMVLEMVKQHLPEFFDYWIGVKTWNSKWYLDDESNISYHNFADSDQHDATNINNKQMGCVQANGSGFWFAPTCLSMQPFVCGRNTADPKIRRTPFAPHQEIQCQNAGGKCKMNNDCADGNQISHLCSEQATDIQCCIPKKSKPQPLFNFTTCTDAGGICNHVIYDECREGLVVYGLQQPCQDRPRRYDCCVKNETLV